MYRKQSEEDEEKTHQMYYDHRARLNNDGFDMCKGNVIKANCVKKGSEEMSSNNSSLDENAYENKVNEILQQSEVNDQSSIDDIEKKMMQAQKILQKNSIQTQINNLIEDEER